jgi:ethanolamine ammonia-lyase small subunit
MSTKLIVPDPWQALRRFTDARIALGWAGHALPTEEVLRFQLSHAQARDAVQQAVDFDAIAVGLKPLGLASETLHSQAADRAGYLKRPDLGRLLAEPCRQRLLALRDELESHEVVLIIGDGLSAHAVQQQAVPTVARLVPQFQTAGIRLCPTVFLARQARVALADDIGELLRAAIAVMLIGERPGLSSPDSLGIYLTYGPRRGRQNAERNCISNVRPAGLSHAQAAFKLTHLIQESLRLKLSGVALKDQSDIAHLPGNR